MKFENIIQNVQRSKAVVSMVPLNTIPIYPRFLIKDGKVLAEVFYAPTAPGKGRYNIYPVGYRVQFDVDAQQVVLIENFKKAGVDYSKNLGSYIELLKNNDISVDDIRSYAAVYDLAAENGTFDAETMQTLNEMWNKCTPKEIKATIPDE